MSAGVSVETIACELISRFRAVGVRAVLVPSWPYPLITVLNRAGLPLVLRFNPSTGEWAWRRPAFDPLHVPISLPTDSVVPNVKAWMQINHVAI